MVSAYIRLAHKYQMDDLLEQWTDYLKDHFTNSFDVWKSHEQVVPKGMQPIHAIGVVNLARLTGCHSILPTALSVCTMLGEAIVHGFPRTDGFREQLGSDDLARCFKLKGDLIQANAVVLLKTLLSESAPFCQRPGHCRAKLAQVLASYKIRNFAADFAPAGLVPRWKMYDEELHSYGVCDVCRDALRLEYHNEQVLVWRQLPEMLGIEVDGWERSE